MQRCATITDKKLKEHLLDLAKLQEGSGEHLMYPGMIDLDLDLEPKTKSIDFSNLFFLKVNLKESESLILQALTKRVEAAPNITSGQNSI